MDISFQLPDLLNPFPIPSQIVPLAQQEETKIESQPFYAMGRRRIDGEIRSRYTKSHEHSSSSPSLWSTVHLICAAHRTYWSKTNMYHCLRSHSRPDTARLIRRLAPHSNVQVLHSSVEEILESTISFLRFPITSLLLLPLLHLGPPFVIVII